MTSHQCLSLPSMCRRVVRAQAMTDDQKIEALEQALSECAEAALDRIEALEELLVECTEVLIARGGHGGLVAHIRHRLDGEPPDSTSTRPPPVDRQEIKKVLH